MTAPAIDGPGARDGDGPHSESGAPAGNRTPGDSAAPEQPSGTGPDGPPPAPIRPAAKINLTIPLATLLGLADHPGEATGFGPIDATLARDPGHPGRRTPRNKMVHHRHRPRRAPPRPRLRQTRRESRNLRAPDRPRLVAAHAAASPVTPGRPRATVRQMASNLAHRPARPRHPGPATRHEAALSWRQQLVRHQHRGTRRIRDLATTAAWAHPPRTGRDRLAGTGRRS